MKNITFLGPVGSTFSHDAYVRMAAHYGTPQVHNTADETNCVPATSNDKILEMVIAHGGYGAIAMQTLAKGRVDEPVESFIELLRQYDNVTVPFGVIGGIGMELHFCLMAKPGVTSQNAKGIVAHPQSFNACKKRVAALGLPTTEATSNGEAARLVAESSNHSEFLALGPKSAAEKYGLQVIELAFEDKRAVTTFFLLAPKSRVVVTGEQNRVLLVCQVPHRPKGLEDTLHTLGEKGFSLDHIHSVHIENGTYYFAMELPVAKEELGKFEGAMVEFRKVCDRYLQFGPFEVLQM